MKIKWEKLNKKLVVDNWHNCDHTLAIINLEKWKKRISRLMGDWITGQNCSNLEKINSNCRMFLVSGRNKYLDSGQSKHSHTVEVVCTTVPQSLNEQKVLRWKNFKRSSKRS